ncbi:MAG: NAD(P)-dependent oxidoreductase [Candidatus Omnitrophota bacterium]|nr:NAD(P)-dependent oxidoreductase [Candidatus Omnitrophota bacterium]MDZ4242380.1 NAD(P)-dependent oxidoreductase [Candidatus Omnitrophota bacterium]
MKKNSLKKRVGVIGTGFISKGFYYSAVQSPDVAISRALTRRDPRDCRDFPGQDLLTDSIEELIDHSDIVLECSGHVIHATETIDRVLKAGIPVVTMDAEFHVTTGSYFVGKGVVTEADGDQPGCLAALREDVTAMGFKPVVYGNVKGFYNPNPAIEDMRFWSKKQGISLAMVTGATDGTKLQYEQALVANGFGAAIYQDGMLGWDAENIAKSAFDLVEHARKLSQPISDYVVNGKSPVRVFIVAEGDPRQKDALEYLKMGPGPYYFFHNNAILCHMEIIKTVRRILNGGPVLLDNSSAPTVSIAAITKHKIVKGHAIRHPLGSFDIRGIAVRIKDHADHVPMGLLSDVIFKRDVDEGQMVRWDDVEVPESLALKAWHTVAQRVLK